MRKEVIPMLKHRIRDIYKDNATIFENNYEIEHDEELSFLQDFLHKFDLITKLDYGEREILVKFLDEDNLDYVLEEIQNGVYVCLIKNLRKYSLLFDTDQVGEDIVPTNDYKITRQYGEEEKHFNYGRKDEQNTIGQKTTTDTIGNAQQTITTAPRSTDSQDQRTTFDSTTDYDTTHNVTGTIQTVDTVADAQRQNQRLEGQQVVDKAILQHSDGVVYEEHTDNVFGYKGNPTKNLETYRKYLDDNTLKTIVEDCMNTVTYSIYLT